MEYFGFTNSVKNLIFKYRFGLVFGLAKPVIRGSGYLWLI